MLTQLKFMSTPLEILFSKDSLATVPFNNVHIDILAKINNFAKRPISRKYTLLAIHAKQIKRFYLRYFALFLKCSS